MEITIILIVLLIAGTHLASYFIDEYRVLGNLLIIISVIGLVARFISLTLR